jgi:hypothetical protein
MSDASTESTVLRQTLQFILSYLKTSCQLLASHFQLTYCDEFDFIHVARFLGIYPRFSVVKPFTTSVEYSTVSILYMGRAGSSCPHSACCRRGGANGLVKKIFSLQKYLHICICRINNRSHNNFVTLCFGPALNCFGKCPLGGLSVSRPSVMSD